jgi:hypothetical protein
VIAHGWNNDIADARDLYRRFLARLREQLDARNDLDARKFGVLTVFWPSKKFAEKELIPSGAASAGGALSNELVREELDHAKGAFDDPAADAALEEAKALVPQLDNSSSARARFADLIRSLLGEDEVQPEEVSTQFFTLPGDELLKRLSVPTPITGGTSRPAGGAAAICGTLRPAADPGGGAAGLGQALSGVKGAAFKLLNLTTYYKMKERAGTVGREGLSPLLRRLRERRPNLKIHLIGHSFGGRLVAAAALGQEGQPAVKPDTMSLLQAAFSHHGFAQRFKGDQDGFFRKVLTERRVAGPILVTCTRNDDAVGRAYPIASQIAGQQGAALGDKNDPFGGIGANGAQKTPEATDGKLLAAGGAYQFAAGKVHNLNADAFIANHSDICKNEVAHAVLTAVAAT